MSIHRFTDTRYRTILVGALLLLLVACSNDTITGGTTPTRSSGTTGTASGMPMHATAMPTMGADGMSGAGMPGMSGMTLTDVQFIDGMIVHHQGAITMATEATTAASRPEVKQLAATIVTTQDPEITQLQGWRTQWYANEAQTTATMLESMGMGNMMIAHDPAKDFDQRFLEAMIAHHRGAVQMAETIKATATHPEIRTFAEKVITDQTAEITQMEGWIKEWYGQ